MVTSECLCSWGPPTPTPSCCTSLLDDPLFAMRTSASQRGLSASKQLFYFSFCLILRKAQSSWGPWHSSPLDEIVVQSLSCVWLFVVPWTAARQAPLSSLSPGVCSDSCPLSRWSRWCCPTISSSAITSFFCLEFFPASGSFLMSHLFTSGDRSIEASASATVLPKNSQGCHVKFLLLPGALRPPPG